MVRGVAEILRLRRRTTTPADDVHLRRGIRPEERHEELIVVPAIKLSCAMLHSFDHEAELLIERDRSAVGGEDLELDSLDARAPGCLERGRGEATADTAISKRRHDAHAQPPAMLEPFARMTRDVAPTDYLTLFGYGDDVDAAAGSHGANERERAFDRRRLHQADVASLARDNVDRGVKASDMFLRCRNDANVGHE